MTKRLWLKVGRATSPFALVVGMIAALPTSAGAQIVQVTRADARHSIGFNLGYLAIKGEDGRPDICFTDDDDCDTLVANLRGTDPLFFEFKDFNFVTFGAEWLYGVSRYLETGVGLSFYQRSVPSVYDDLVNTNGTEIGQDLKLRMVPFTATVRFLPVGREGAVEPYIGGGVAFVNWRYSETGEFVDSSDGSSARTTRRTARQLGRCSSAACAFPRATRFSRASRSAGRRPRVTRTRSRASCSGTRSISAERRSTSRCT
jgi:hypothetical protein